MSHHMVITAEDCSDGRRYKAVGEFDDGSVVDRSLVIRKQDLEIEGRPRRAVEWSLNCDFRRYFPDPEKVVKEAINELLEANPGAFS